MLIRQGADTQKYPHKTDEKKELSTNLALFGKKVLAASYSSMLLCIVPSAMKVLASVFGMGTGVSPSPMPPTKLISITLVIDAFFVISLHATSSV